MRNFIFLLVIFIAACGNNNGEKQTSVDSTDVQVIEKFIIDTTTSVVNWDRYKKSKNTNSNFSLGKVNISMNVAEVEFTTTGSFKLLKGEWKLTDKTILNGYMVVDLTKAASLKVGKDNKLTVGSPDYLDIEKYPTAKIEFTKMQLNCDSCEVEAKLSIKDTTGKITFPAIIVWENSVPKEMKAKFSIDGKKWGLVNKNATGTVVQDKLTFDCIIKSSTKASSVIRETKVK